MLGLQLEAAVRGQGVRQTLLERPIETLKNSVLQSGPVLEGFSAALARQALLEKPNETLQNSVLQSGPVLEDFLRYFLTMHRFSSPLRLCPKAELAREPVHKSMAYSIVQSNTRDYPIKLLIPFLISDDCWFCTR